MKIRRFLSFVPKGVRIAALIVASCAMLAGLIVGYFAHFDSQIAAYYTMGAGAAFGLLFGSVIAVWLLCLGYVYADARRRSMRPVLWVLVAILVPHLLGFLFYFLLRQPIAATCTNCGEKNSLNYRYCSWCGSPQPPAPAGGAPSGPGSSGLDSLISA